MTKVDVLLENETAWLSLANMAELFQTTKQNIGQRIKNIFNEGELDENSVIKNFFTTAAALTFCTAALGWLAFLTAI